VKGASLCHQSNPCETARRLGRPALALAICGETAEAEKLAAETSKHFPDGTIWNAVQLPESQAMIALHRDRLPRSVELMASASPYERAYLDAMYVRGLAYLKMHKGSEAAAEFQKIVDHNGANWGATWIHPNCGQYYALSIWAWHAAICSRARIIMLLKVPRFVYRTKGGEGIQSLDDCASGDSFAILDAGFRDGNSFPILR
jgi:hypothetical protein